MNEVALSDPVKAFSFLLTNNLSTLEPSYVIKLIEKSIGKSDLKGVYERFILAYNQKLIDLSIIDIKNNANKKEFIYNFVNSRSPHLIKLTEIQNEIYLKFCSFLNRLVIHFYFHQSKILFFSTYYKSLDETALAEIEKLKKKIKKEKILEQCILNSTPSSLKQSELIEYISYSLLFVTVPINLDKFYYYVINMNRNIEWLNVLLDNGLDIDLELIDGMSALMIACNDSSLVDVNWLTFLIRMGANINLKNKIDGKTSLLYAALNKNRSNDFIFDILLSNGAQVDLQDKDGLNPLMVAAMSGNSERLTRLIQHGATIDLLTSTGRNTLILASENDHISCVTLLLMCGAKVNLEDVNGFSALSLTASSLNLQCLDALLEYGANPNMVNNKSWIPSITATQSGCYINLQKLIENGCQVDFQTKHGTTALMIAARYSFYPCVKLLVESGANVDLTENYERRTAIMAAITEQETDCLEILLKNTTNVNYKDHEGCSTLTLAAKRGNTKSIELLLKYKAEVNTTDIIGYSPLIHTIFHNHFSSFKLLLEKGADPNLTNHDGWSPLMFVTRFGRTQYLEFLLIFCQQSNITLDINLQNKDGKTALMFAAIYKHPYCTKMLLDHEADPTLEDSDKRNALWYSENSGVIEIKDMIQSRSPPHK